MSEGLTKKAISGGLWMLVQQWGQQFFAFVVFLVLARVLDARAFGLVSLASLFVTFTLIFANQGFSEAIVQRRDLRQEHLDSAFWGNATLSFGLTSVMFILARPIAKWFAEPVLASIIQWLSLSFIINCFSTIQGALLRREMLFRSLAMRTLIAESCGGVVGIGMVVAGCGVWSLVGMRLASQIAGCIALWRFSDWRPSLQFSWLHYKHLFLFGINIVGIGVCAFFYRETSDLLIGKILGAVALGFYTIAFNTIQRLNGVLIGVISQVTLPAFARVQDEPQRLLRGYFSATEIAASISFPIFVGLSIVAPQMVPVAFGVKWMSSVPLLQCLALIGIRDSLLFLDNQVMTALGKPSWRLAVSMANVGLSVLGVLIGIRWGLMGVAVGLTLASFLIWPISLLAMRRLINFSLAHYFARYVAPCASSLTMAAVVIIVRRALPTSPSAWSLTVMVCAGAIAYGAVTWIIAPASLRMLTSQLVSSLSRQGTSAPEPSIAAAEQA